MLEWEMGTFSTPMLGLLLFVSLAIFPALLLPSAPSMWITGMTFGYGYGFLLIMAATSLGMSLPYFIGSLFHHKIHVSTLRWFYLLFHFYQKNESRFWSFVNMETTFDTFLAEVAGQMAQEICYYKTSWWRGLVSSVSSCCLTQNFSVSLHCVQLCCCCHKCWLWSLHIWIIGRNSTWSFSHHLQVWSLYFFTTSLA